MLDLVRMSPRLRFPPGGVELYRQIALLTGMGEGCDVLDVACGSGVALEYFVAKYGVHGSGVEEDSRLVDEAEARARQGGLSGALLFQVGRADSLPYRDASFDVTVGELGMTAHCTPDAAARELVRVTKPGGSVVLVQLVWKAPVDEAQQVVLSEDLGVRPLMLVEWRRFLRDAGVVEIHAEGWSDDETSFRPKVTKPFPDFAEIFSLWEKIVILRRAWVRWGWRAVRTLLEREWRLHRVLSRDRILGLDLLKGRKVDSDAPVASVPDAAPSVRGTPKSGTAGLPLFSGDE